MPRASPGCQAWSIRWQPLQQGVDVDGFFDRAALGVAQEKTSVARRLDPPHTDAAVPARLLQNARAVRRSRQHCAANLPEIVDAPGVAAEWKITDREQHIFRAEPKDRVGVGADEYALRGHVAQHGVEHLPGAAAFDRVVPHQHAAHPLQLDADFVDEVVVVDGWLGGNAGRGQRREELGKSTFGGIGAIAHRAVTRIQQSPALACVEWVLHAALPLLARRALDRQPGPALSLRPRDASRIPGRSACPTVFQR
jgi:hypothetical protein